MDNETEIPDLPGADEHFPGDDIAAEILATFHNSPLEEHHNLCATVGAISQAIKEQGLPLTPVAYFAASVSSFVRLVGDPPVSSGDPDVSAILSFLSIILPRVSPAVLRSKSDTLSDSLARVLTCGTLPVNGMIEALKCISHMLVISDKHNWSSVSQLYGILLNCITDNTIKVRKQSYSCLRDVLQSFQGSTFLVLASKRITTALGRFLLLGGSNPPSLVTEEEPKGAREVLYTLNALKECIDLVSVTSTNIILKYCCQLLNVRQSSVTRSIIEILQTLCSRHASNFSPEYLLELLCSLARFIPEKEKSADGMSSIARLLSLGTKRVFILNRNICTVKLPLIFSSLGEILVSGHEEAIFAAKEALKSLAYSCIDESLVMQGIEQINLNGSRGIRKSDPTIIEKICAILESFLDFRYNAVWDAAFEVISTAFDQLGRYSPQLMERIVRNLADMQSLADNEFSYKKQLHECLGSALAAMGPEKFLGLLPLNLDSENIADANVWQLPILKHYIVGAEMHFFSQYILGMAKHLKHKSLKLEREGHIFSSRSAEGFVYSLWSLFPSFCNYPVDTSTSFKEIHDVLCNTLLQKPELHGVICTGLQLLIQQNKSAFEERIDIPDEELSFHVRKAKEYYTTIVAEENLNCLRTASKLLSVLCEIFLKSPKDNGGCLQSTIHLFASISTRKTVKNLFRKYMMELLEETKKVLIVRESNEASSMHVDNLPDKASITHRRARRLDLAVLLLPGLVEEEIDVLYNAIKHALQDEEGLMQKKAYKILSLILMESEGFLSKKLDELLQLIIMATSSCHFSAKRHRLDCLYFLIVHISKETSPDQRMREFISAFLTEILLALKEANKKTRNKAYDLLVEIGRACGDEERGGRTEKLHQLFNMVAGGMVSETPHMVSASIKGLARLVYEFSDLISAAYKLLPSSFLLLQRRNREIVKANLGLIKVLAAKSKADGLETHLKGIVEGLLKWKDETKNHFKAKIKSLIEMLVRKCGIEAVKAVMPEEHLKLLKNIRKIKERKEKKSKSQADTNSLHSRTSVSRQSRWNHTRIFSDIEDDIGEDGSAIENGRHTRTTRASLRSRRMRREVQMSFPEDMIDQSEDPIDLLDVQKIRSILQSTSKAKRKVVESYDDEPEIDNDGRLIVREEWEKPKKPKSSSEPDSDAKSLAASRKSGKSSLGPQKKRQKTESGWSYTGVEYSSKKAGGDLKKKGKLEPYAYWPLDRKLLNRRLDRKVAARKGMKSVMLTKDLKKLEGRSSSSALARAFKRRRGKK